jgi:SNF2 family DNA or RNA helicase
VSYPQFYELIIYCSCPCLISLNTLRSLVANLLPFQVEGFSWMRHQEVMCSDIRGGILADEMGTTATFCSIYDPVD